MEIEKIMNKIDPDKLKRMNDHIEQSVKDLDDLVSKSIQEQIGMAAAIKFLGNQIAEVRANTHLTELVVVALTELLEEQEVLDRDSVAERVQELDKQEPDTTLSDIQPQQADQPSTEAPLSQDETLEYSQTP